MSSPALLSQGAVMAGNLRETPGAGYAEFMLEGTVGRTDTTPKNLYVLPPNAVLHRVEIAGTVASNAGTTATVDVGKTGTQNFFVAAHDVKTAGKGDAANVAVTKNPGAQGGVQVTATYAETGTASSAGGPWTVRAYYHIP